MNNKELKSLDEALDYLNEGKVLDRIKGIINNIINKNQKNNKKAPSKKSSSNPVPKFTLEKVSGKSQFDKLYNSEAMCAEGLSGCDKEETAQAFANVIASWKGCPKEIHFYYCFGKDLNSTYHLTDDNMYPNDLGIFFIDWSNFGKDYDATSHKGSFRWFSDVVDNNARREIIKGNDFYKDYHSLYGDDWFYSQIKVLSK